MNVPLPAEFESRISSQEAALYLAIGLFRDDKLTLGQASAVAGISEPAFLQELGKRRISVHYGVKDLEEDIATVKSITSGAR